MNYKRILSKASRCVLPSCNHHALPSIATRTATAGSTADPRDAFRQSLLPQLFNSNNDWVNESGDYFSSNVDNVLNTQIPHCTLLTCCDSRVSSCSLGLVDPNLTFEIRNIGNQAPNALGSISYGVGVLGTPYLLIMGHTACGAVVGASSDYRNLNTNIQGELLSLTRSIQFAEFVMDKKAEDIGVNVLAEINVDFQVMQLMDDLKISQAVESGKLTVVGMMYDIHNAYGSGNGRIHCVNINGETDVAALRSNDLFDSLADVDRDAAIARLHKYSKPVSYRDFTEAYARPAPTKTKK